MEFFPAERGPRWKRPPCRHRASLFCLVVLTLFLRVCTSHAGEDGCTDCHDMRSILSGAQSLHPPFSDDECDACHLDHGDDEVLILTSEGNALCDECHDASDGEVVGAHNGFTV